MESLSLIISRTKETRDTISSITIIIIRVFYRHSFYSMLNPTWHNYNGIMFNTESFLRDKNFLIPKICMGAINAFKNGKELRLNNVIVSREWNWCSEQCELMLKFLRKKPQDFILSNGKSYLGMGIECYVIKANESYAKLRECPWSCSLE